MSNKESSKEKTADGTGVIVGATIAAATAAAVAVAVAPVTTVACVGFGLGVLLLKDKSSNLKGNHSKSSDKAMPTSSSQKSKMSKKKTSSSKKSKMSKKTSSSQKLKMSKKTCSNSFNNSKTHMKKSSKTLHNSVCKNSSNNSGKNSVTPRKVHFGNLTSDVTPLDKDLTWKNIIIQKLMSYVDENGNKPYEAYSNEELDSYATILGDAKSFYNHFFKGEVAVNDDIRKDYEEIVRNMSRATEIHNDDRQTSFHSQPPGRNDESTQSTIHTMDIPYEEHQSQNDEQGEPTTDFRMTTAEVESLVQRQMAAINTVANGRGSLEVAMSFTEIDGNTLLRTLGKMVSTHGYIHAAIILNQDMVLEWGAGDGGESLVIPRIAMLDDLQLSILAHRRESSFFGMMYEATTAAFNHPLQTLADLFSQLKNYFSSFLRLGQANSNDLWAIAELITEWNRNYHYDPVFRNCQHFMEHLLEDVRPIGKPKIRFGPVLKAYLDSVSSGDATLDIPLCSPDCPTFDNLDIMDDFVASGKHNDLGVEEKYLLGMFHTVLCARYRMDGNEERVRQSESEFGWSSFKRSSSQALSGTFDQV